MILHNFQLALNKNIFFKDSHDTLPCNTLIPYPMCDFNIPLGVMIWPNGFEGKKYVNFQNYFHFKKGVDILSYKLTFTWPKGAL